MYDLVISCQLTSQNMSGIYDQPLIAKKQVNILERIKSSEKAFSVELCPSSNFNGEALRNISPSFYSVAWKQPLDSDLQHMCEIPAVALAKQLSLCGYNVLFHIGGRYLDGAQVHSLLNELQHVGVKNLLILQGEYLRELKEKEDFPYASDLVKFIRLHYGDYFCIGVVGYPQKHPRSLSKEEDLKYLKLKVDAGADFLLTQMFFDLESFKSFYGGCRNVGINVPIIPGVFIISSHKSLSVTAMCKVEVPQDVAQTLTDRLDPAAVRSYGISHCTSLLKQLLSSKDMHITNVHFFSFNNIELVEEVCKDLGFCVK